MHPDLFKWLTLLLLVCVLTSHAFAAAVALLQRRWRRLIVVGANACFYLFGTAFACAALMTALLAVGLCSFHGGCSFNDDLVIALIVLATSTVGAWRLYFVAQRPD
jgi:hypothetical protein